MPYLTYDEFQKISDVEIDDKKFNSLIKKASAVLNAETSYFYVKNSIEDDNPWRVNQFKLALCTQIEYFHEVGSSTFEGINKTPQSFQAGRTNVSNTNRFNSGRANERKSLVAEDVYIFLSGTGLLYRGVSVW